MPGKWFWKESQGNRKKCKWKVQEGKGKFRNIHKNDARDSKVGCWRKWRCSQERNLESEKFTEKQTSPYWRTFEKLKQK